MCHTPHWCLLVRHLLIIAHESLFWISANLNFFPHCLLIWLNVEHLKAHQSLRWPIDRSGGSVSHHRKLQSSHLRPTFDRQPLSYYRTWRAWRELRHHCKASRKPWLRLPHSVHSEPFFWDLRPGKLWASTSAFGEGALHCWTPSAHKVQQ